MLEWTVVGFFVSHTAHVTFEFTVGVNTAGGVPLFWTQTMAQNGCKNYE